MTKQELEAKVNDLELTLNAVELNAKCLKDDLIEANEKLANINKPVITKEFVEEIREAVYQAINQINFNNVDSYEVDFEIDYNNTLAVGNIEFNEVDDINETVCDYIEDLFNVIEEDEN